MEVLGGFTSRRSTTVLLRCDAIAMPLPTIPGVTRCAIRMTKAGVRDEIVNVIHLGDTTAATPTDIDDVLEPAWQTMLHSVIPIGWLWQDVTYTKLDGSASQTLIWTQSEPTSTTAPIPTQCAAVLSWRTATSGRSHRGRSYVGPLTQDAVDLVSPDLLVASEAAFLFGAATAFLAQLATGGFPLVVASYTLSTAEDVGSVKVNPKMCTMRKRANGR